MTIRGRLLNRAVLALLAAVLCGCGLWRPTPVPLRTVVLDAACAQRPSTLLVFLPGSYSLPEDFISHGFVDRVRRQHVAADILLVDAHLGYYTERSILERLKQDVLAPARARGYARIWLVGISVGGFGALLQAAANAEETAYIDGIVAIAPYLGERRLSASIAAAGGLSAWQAPAKPAVPIDEEGLWRWLQAHAAKPKPLLYLGYGDDDRFAASDRLLGAVLPPQRVFTAAGGHDWPVWETLWEAMLPTLPLRRDRSCAA